MFSPACGEAFVVTNYFVDGPSYCIIGVSRFPEIGPASRVELMSWAMLRP
jgi:hypothetical protein